MAVYAVYAREARSPRWQLQQVFDLAPDAERYAATLVQASGARGAGRWVEALVEYYPSRSDIHEVLPANHVAAVTARFTRTGFAEVT
jgi:hypothetical protein